MEQAYSTSMDRHPDLCGPSYTNKDVNFHYWFTHPSPMRDYELHCHPTYEIYYFVSGNASYLVEGNCYRPTPHSLLMIPAGVFHGVRIESAGEYGRFALHFNSNLLPPEHRHILLSPFHKEDGAPDIYYENVQEFRLFQYFEALIDSAKMPEEHRDMALSISIQSILSQILYMSRCTKGVNPKENMTEQLAQILHYLNQNFTEPHSLDELSARFYISKHYMNKLFRKATGTTIGEYVIMKRISAAQSLMAQGYSAAQAGINTGFGDYSSFYRAYRKVTGHSPREDKEI